MKVTAVTKLKQGDLYNALQRLGWSQSELARRANISPTTIGKILSMQKRPGKMAADGIQRAFGEAGIYIDVLSVWPETFKGLGVSVTLTQTKEIDVLKIPSRVNPRQIELRSVVDKVLETLEPEEREVVEGRMSGKTYVSIGKQIGKSHTRAKQIEDKALRRLRHPTKSRMFNEYRDEYGWIDEDGPLAAFIARMELLD